MWAFAGLCCYLTAYIQASMECSKSESIEKSERVKGKISFSKERSQDSNPAMWAASTERPVDVENLPIHRSQVFSGRLMYGLWYANPDGSPLLLYPLSWPWVSCSNMCSVDPWCSSRPTGTEQCWRTSCDEWTAERQSQLAVSCPAWRTSLSRWWARVSHWTTLFATSGWHTQVLQKGLGKGFNSRFYLILYFSGRSIVMY